MDRRRFLSIASGAGIAALSGCSGNSNDAESNDPSGLTSRSQSGGQTETIELRVGSFAPEDAFYTSRFTYPIWLEKVNRMLDDYEISPEFLGAGAVGGPGELYNLAADGTIDMALGIPAYQEGRMPLSLVGTLPGLFPPTTEGHSAAAQALHEMATPGGESELIYKEYSNLGVRPIMAFTIPPSQIQTNKLIISNVDQLKGIRVQAAGVQGRVANKLGMSPANIPQPDIHSAFQSGTIDGIITGMAATYSNSWYDQVNYATTNLNLGGFHVGWAMGEDTLKEFPSPVREAITRAGRETVAEYASNVQQGVQDIVMASDNVVTEEPFEKDNQYMVYETEAADSIHNSIEPVVDSWTESQDATAAREVVETYQSLQKKYK